MHDPDVQVFEIHIPVPVKKWASRAPNGLRRRRYTGGGPEHVGKPMYPTWRPAGWEVVIHGSRIGWWNVLEVWHTEPGGADSGKVCKGMGGSQLTWRNVKWAWRHRRHIRVWSPPVRRVKAWRTLRCAGCGLRFRWKNDARFSPGWGAREVYHDPCMSLRTVRGQLDDAYAVMTFTADDDAKWRVEYVLKRRDEMASTTITGETA